MMNDSIFVRERNEPTVYVIHQRYHNADGMLIDTTLPYFFKSRKQANRYLKDYLGATFSHGEFISNDLVFKLGDIRRQIVYKVQHLSGMHEYTLDKKTGRYNNMYWMILKKLTT